MFGASPHQYVERGAGRVLDEALFGDRVVRFLYSRTRERAPVLFRAFTGARFCRVIGTLNFDLPLLPRLLGSRSFLRSCGVDLEECLDPPESFDTPRKIFERRIRYWEKRPLESDPAAIVSPADARALVGSLRRTSALFVKDKFFTLEELLGRRRWIDHFTEGDFAIFRLTPEKYHYNHTPVAGRVVAFYELGGAFHSCNPSAVVELVTPYSKNRRVVTVFDTDVPGGSGIGKVAMVEVVALMIGEVVQAYSAHAYDDPRPLAVGDFVVRGQPKSLYRPGSSTDILLFEPGRVDFSPDLVDNLRRGDVQSRFSLGFDHPLVETEVAVRSTIAVRARDFGGNHAD
jgi:phosphatidylserine decarboxylase